uniref:hypothetical protein n=1 Tax=Acetatifactor sp. TaxID=1872090 RepID=UPI004057299B
MKQTYLSPYDRMAKIFEACRHSSKAFLQHKSDLYYENTSSESAQEQAYIHQKYIKYLISELKPSLTEIIQQELSEGLIQFDYPEQLAEIVLIVLTVKLDNTLSPASPQEIEYCVRALVYLLEKGTGTPPGALDYLTEI